MPSVVDSIGDIAPATSFYVGIGSEVFSAWSLYLGGFFFLLLDSCQPLLWLHLVMLSFPYAGLLTLAQSQLCLYSVPLA